MDLEIDVNALTAAGRKKLPLIADVVRPLRSSDLVLLATNRHTEQPELKRISERHHQLARALASGIRPGIAATSLGWTPARVSVLKQSPAFRELIDFYKDAVDAEFADFAASMSGLGLDAVQILRERLEENPDDIDSKTLLSIATNLADRTGHGPTKTENVNVNVSLVDKLKTARLRAREAMKSAVDADVIEGQAIASN